jgi:hypothetical protein
MRSGLFGVGEGGSRGLDGIDPVVLGAAGAFVVLDLNDVFTRLGKDADQAGGEAAGTLQRPDATARCAAHRPSQHPTVGRTICRIAVLAVHSAGNGVEDGQVDRVSIGVTADDEVVVLEQHDHLPLVPS